MFSILCFRLFSTYSGIVRYSSFVDLQKVGYANIVAMALSVGACIVMRDLPMEHYARLTMQQTIAIFFISTVVMWAMRVLVKILYDIATSNKRAMRVLIYGAMTGGVGLAKNIRSQKPTRFVLKGFISHDPRYRHNLLMGEKVYIVEDDLAAVIREKDIEAVLVSPLRTNDFRNEPELQDTLLGAGVKIFIAQQAKEWDGKSEDMADVQLHEVSVEDLLPRDEIKVDMGSIGKLLAGKRVLITGSAGSIGSEMVRQVAYFKPAAMMLIDQAETPEHDIRLMMAKEFPDVKATTVVTSICKADRMERIFADFRPEYVFHAAAYKHVPMMEDNPSEAVQNNVYGTKVIADLADKYGVSKFVMVSTDKAVNPTNVMGCSKRICEIYVQSLNKRSKTQFVTTRFGNVLGSNGSVIPLFREQIKKGGPVTVTHAHSRSLQAGARSRHAGPGRRDLRLRHGQARAHSRSGQAHDPPVGRQERGNQVHGSAGRREAVRRSAQRAGGYQALVQREDTHSRSAGVRLRRSGRSHRRPDRDVAAIRRHGDREEDEGDSA